MTRYSGEVGFGFTEESPSGSGKWVDRIVPKEMKGDVRTSSQRVDSSSTVNPNITLSNVLSLVGSTYALEHYHLIRYAMWNNVRWTVTNVEVQRPRLILSLGEVYNGPTPPESP